MDAYYRQSLLQLWGTNADRNVRRNTTGRYRAAPPGICAPLADVREEDMARGPNYTGKPTPKAVASRREAYRKRGERVYDSANALALWKRLDEPRPTPSERPRNPMEGFDDDDAIELANRGPTITKKALGPPPPRCRL